VERRSGDGAWDGGAGEGEVDEDWVEGESRSRTSGEDGAAGGCSKTQGGQG
jgi:hypothetical protein